uniref:Uncharacterized protein n=1 Tax=Anguilla anguilla TaxID=7936 RepID=A0A0E9TJ98_ANGAN
MKSQSTEDPAHIASVQTVAGKQASQLIAN